MASPLELLMETSFSTASPLLFTQGVFDFFCFYSFSDGDDSTYVRLPNVVLFIADQYVEKRRMRDRKEPWKNEIRKCLKPPKPR